MALILLREMMEEEGIILILINYLKYGFRDTMRSLWRHKGMVIVSLLTVATTLLVLGATLLLAFNSQNVATSMEDQLEIIAFLRTDVTREEALNLAPIIHGIPGYESEVFVPKEDALVIMGEKFDSEVQLTDALGGSNPLPDAYNIKVESPELIPSVVAALEGLEAVEMVRYGQDLVNNMVKLTDVLTMGCIALIVGMMIAALFLVNSTIRLTVSARSEEIAIMKYVGATNFYVRIPFFLEGLIIGIMGAVLATVALYFGYNTVITYMVENITFIPVLDDPKLLGRIVLSLILGGTLLGALGSNIAVKKYLKV